MKIRKRPIGTDKNTRLSSRGCCCVVAPGPKINADVNNSWINKCLESVSADSRLNLSSSSSYFGQKFFFFSFFSEGFLSISHRRPSITVWQNGPNNHVHPNSPHLSPPSLENVPNRPDAKVPVSLSSPIVPKGNCWKERRGGRPFWSATYYLPLLFDWSLSLLCVSCVNVRVFRAACHAWLFINLTNCAESVCLCVCVERTLALLVKRRDGQMRATNEWLAVAPFVSPFFGLEQKFFDLISLGRDNSKPRKWLRACHFRTHTHREREREKKEPYPIEADGRYSVYNSPLVSWQLLRPSGSRFSST